MAYKTPEKLVKLKPYTPSKGSFDVVLNANESFIDAGKRMEQKVREALAGVPLNRYPDPECTGLRRAYARLHGLNPDCLTVSNGSDEIISIIINTMLPQNAKVVTLEPDFSMYSFYSCLAGHEVISIDKGDSLAINVDEVIRHVNLTDADMLIFSNPCNPTSLVLARDEVLRIAASTDALIVVDEAYMEFSDQSILDKAAEYDNLIVLRTCSKALGLAALRLGIAVSSPGMAKLLHTVKSPFNVNSVSQAIGEAVLSDAGYISECTKAAIESRESLYGELMKIKSNNIERIFKSQTNFVFMRMRDALSVTEQLEREGISVRRLGGFIRVTAGSSKENERFLTVFKRLVEEVK